MYTCNNKGIVSGLGALLFLLFVFCSSLLRWPLLPVLPVLEHYHSVDEHHDSANVTRLLESHIQPNQSVLYSQLNIQVNAGSKPDNRSLPHLDTDFSPQFTALDSLSQLQHVQSDARTLHLDLPTPQHPHHGTGDLMFGLASDVQRLRDNLPHMRHWLPNNGVPVVVLVPPDPGVSDLVSDWEALGIKLTVVQRDQSFLERLLGLLPLMLSHSVDRHLSTKWFMILDDDTFLPSVSRLTSALAAYDPSYPFYIGGMSEPRSDLCNVGYWAFGGAGVIFSAPLARQLSPHFPDECIEKGKVNGGGDWHLAECVYEFSSTRMTYLQELHQTDVLGDKSGIYESGFKPLTLHHWRSYWDNVPMDKVASVASITGDEALFQRWRFADGWVLTNGFSITKYDQRLLPGNNQDYGSEEHEDDAEKIDFARMEFTWENGRPDDFIHSIGPFRRKLTAEEKIQWRFVDALEDGRLVRQFYTKTSESQVEVIEVVWMK